MGGNKIGARYQCHHCSNSLDAEKWIQERPSAGGDPTSRSSLRVVFNNVCSPDLMTLTWLCSLSPQDHKFYCMDCGYCSPSVDQQKCNIKFFESLDTCTL